MKVLWIATKAPWPPVDGGRLLLWNSLRALHERGVEVTLVAPAASDAVPTQLAEVCRPVLVKVPALPGRGGIDFLLANMRRQPWTIRRHSRAPVRRTVAELLGSERFDVVQVEQVQALAQVPDDLPDLPPVVLRAQNVESDLWLALAARPGTAKLLASWLRRQGGLLARHEGEAVRRCAATVALTDEDAEGLRRLAAGDGDPAPDVDVVRAPVDPELAAGEPLAGDPAVVVFGSSGWKPNADGARHFLAEAWPQVRAGLPGAVLHLFGGDELVGAEVHDGVLTPPAPDDSAVALARDSVLVVPLWVASGVRMKILEAWARGVAVVATPAAARGLGATAGGELLVAEEPAQLARAVTEAVSRYDQLAAAAQARVRAEHSFDAFAEGLLAVWGRLGGA